ncbi:hypothetical protein AZI86_15570 [Bdellovibrio bacteriovorus]|uniref:SsuA/THI5-like domain-containing protein n=1 Tax=Bdellovibrio bacteriovorus TaxID=959 RepID=A0A150WHE9_BDEBC|nr:transporter substrate-binding domain-containing protein [Bdellovibrio bacteriovorus]KYG63131.1 hypothetical protein AZI86_15570 [Bdellovibrio bacteriovorus]
MKNVLVLFFILVFSLSSQAESWKIATLEWPPYVCSKCYKNGAAADALREALQKKGITVEFVFYPWVQTRKMAARRSFVGYFPAWKEEILPDFQASAPLFSSPVSFMERKENPMKWEQLKDLKGKTFAVTEGYGNTAEFNALVKDGSFKTVTLLSEESTIRRLIAGSVDAVLIDMFVGTYYLKKVFSLHRDKIRLNPKVLETKDLYFAFNEASLPKVEVLNTALMRQSFQESVEQYVKQRMK